MRRADENKLSESTRRVLFEATEDLQAVTELLRKRKLRYSPGTSWPYFDIEHGGGFPQCLEALPDLLAHPIRYHRIGIVIDAETGFAERAKALAAKLREFGVPEEIPPGSVAEMPNGQTLGVWIFPNNRERGELEDFLRPALRDDGLWPWAEKAVSRAVEKGARTKNRLKSELRTWLAWQEDPGISDGTALAQTLFDPNDPALAAFVAWFLELFPPDSAD